MARWVERKLDSREELKTAVKKAPISITENAISEQGNDSAAEKLAAVSDTLETMEAQIAGVTKESLPAINASEDGEDLLTRLARLKRSFLPESLRDDMSDSGTSEEPIPAIAKAVKPPDNAPLSSASIRPPKRSSQEVATITIGDQTVTSIIGTPSKRARTDETASEQRHSQRPSKSSQSGAPLPSFNGRLTQMFAAATAEQQDPSEFEPLEDENKPEDDEEIQDPEDIEHVEHDASVSGELFAQVDVDNESGISEEEDSCSDKSMPSQDEGTPPVGTQHGQDDEVLDEQDSDYIDEEEKKAQEDLKVQEIVKAAEEAGHEPSEENQKRKQAFMKGPGKGKYATQALLQRLTIDEESLMNHLEIMESQLRKSSSARDADAAGDFEINLEADNAEERLALTIHKGDFGKMNIIGQFNLGFVLAVRPSNSSTIAASSPPTATQSHQKPKDDELFIIDQHASDEKFNFERLQATTTVQSQRLVRPKPLDLTAVEEEIVIENQAALEKNGFLVAVDTSGEEPVGARCQLLALPLSRETTFSLADLEELISLLGDNPTTTTIDNNNDEDDGGDGRRGGGYVPRPSKVRKMFAMRACRSSIMIGKALSRQQMERVVRHMGEMEKPWNCPHGRPTMRHLCGLGGAWDMRAWHEGNDAGDTGFGGGRGRPTDWAAYVRQRKAE